MDHGATKVSSNVAAADINPQTIGHDQKSVTATSMAFYNEKWIKLLPATVGSQQLPLTKS